jgi:hypothetical protein
MATWGGCSRQHDTARVELSSDPLGIERFGAEEIDVDRAPVGEVQAEARPAGEVEPPLGRRLQGRKSGALGWVEDVVVHGSVGIETRIGHTAYPIRGCRP